MKKTSNIIIRVEDELKEALGKDIDLIFIGTELNDFFKEQLERDKIRLC